jgi:hypothetical protein
LHNEEGGIRGHASPIGEMTNEHGKPMGRENFRGLGLNGENSFKKNNIKMVRYQVVPVLN